MHLTVSPFVAAYAVWSAFSPCAYADASPGIGSLLDREFAKSLGQASWCRFCAGRVPLILSITFLFKIHDNLKNSYIMYNVLFSTVVNVAVL